MKMCQKHKERTISQCKFETLTTAQSKYEPTEYGVQQCKECKMIRTYSRQINDLNRRIDNAQ